MRTPAALVAFVTIVQLLAATGSRADDASPVTCEIAAPAAPLVAGEPLGLEVRVCNASARPLRLLRSAEHSELGARLPITTFVIGGPALVPSELAGGGCPRIAALRRSDVVTLRPGGCFDPFSRRPSVTLATARPPVPGAYSLTFRYATAAPGFGLAQGDAPPDRRALRGVAPVDVACSIELNVIVGE